MKRVVYGIIGVSTNEEESISIYGEQIYGTIEEAILGLKEKFYNTMMDFQAIREDEDTNEEIETSCSEYDWSIHFLGICNEMHLQKFIINSYEPTMNVKESE